MNENTSGPVAKSSPEAGSSDFWKSILPGVLGIGGGMLAMWGALAGRRPKTIFELHENAENYTAFVFLAELIRTHEGGDVSDELVKKAFSYSEKFLTECARRDGIFARKREPNATDLPGILMIERISDLEKRMAEAGSFGACEFCYGKARWVDRSLRSSMVTLTYDPSGYLFYETTLPPDVGTMKVVEQWAERWGICAARSGTKQEDKP